MENSGQDTHLDAVFSCESMTDAKDDTSESQRSPNLNDPFLGHCFTKKNLHKPANCHHCSDLLWGLLGTTGMVCEVCNFLAHEKCVRAVVSPCTCIIPFYIKDPVPHCWSELGHFKRKFCNVCRKRVDDLFALRCEICEYYSHYECLDFASADCKQCAISTVASSSRAPSAFPPSASNSSGVQTTSALTAAPLALRAVPARASSFFNSTAVSTGTADSGTVAGGAGGSFSFLSSSPTAANPSTVTTSASSSVVTSPAQPSMCLGDSVTSPSALLATPACPPPPGTAAMSHHWREGNLPVNSKCAACRKACWSTECLTGMRCEWCGVTIHSSCYKNYPSECDFGVLRDIILPPSCVLLPRTSLLVEQIIGMTKPPQDSFVGVQSLTDEFSSSGDSPEESGVEKKSTKDKSDLDDYVRVYDGLARYRKRQCRYLSLGRSVSVSKVIELSLKAFQLPPGEASDYCLVELNEKDGSEHCLSDGTPFKAQLQFESRRPQIVLRYCDRNLERLFIQAYPGAVAEYTDVELTAVQVPITRDTIARDVIILALRRFGLEHLDSSRFQLVETILDRGLTERPMANGERVWDLIERGRRESVRTLRLTRFYLQHVDQLEAGGEARPDSFLLSNYLPHRAASSFGDQGPTEDQGGAAGPRDRPSAGLRRGPTAAATTSSTSTTASSINNNSNADCSQAGVAVFVGNLKKGLSQRLYERILLDRLGAQNRWDAIEMIYYDFGSLVVSYRSPERADDAYHLLKQSVFEDRPLLAMILPRLQPANLPRGVQPLLVMVNVKSGGCQGLELITSFRKLLNPHQVFNLDYGGPLPGLHCFRHFKQFKILVCGGDGTVGWALSCLDIVGQDAACPTPPMAILPLGTGNDLARVLRWGSGYTGAEEPLAILRDVVVAEKVRLDRWTVVIKPDEVERDAQKRRLQLDANAANTNEDTSRIFVMNNYFGLGIDADLNLDFHMAREENPAKFNSRIHNKSVYLKMGLRKMVNRTKCKDLHQHVQIEVDGRQLELPQLEGIIILNILSWGAGANPWGAEKEEAFSVPTHYDGQLEVVGVTGVVHMGQIFSGLRTGTRLAQGGHIRIIVKNDIPVQVDGEPWIQPPGQIIVLRSALKATMLRKQKRRKVNRRHTEPGFTGPVAPGDPSASSKEATDSAKCSAPSDAGDTPQSGSLLVTDDSNAAKEAEVNKVTGSCGSTPDCAGLSLASPDQLAVLPAGHPCISASSSSPTSSSSTTSSCSLTSSAFAPSTPTAANLPSAGAHFVLSPAEAARPLAPGQKAATSGKPSEVSASSSGRPCSPLKSDGARTS